MADAEWGDPVELGTALCRAGCKTIQLRAKKLSALSIRAAANALIPIVRHHGCLIIINDHVEVAAAVGADGVHLGQDDGPTKIARSILPNGLIGRSTHTLKQVISAQDVDYLGFGPIFTTQTKATGWSARGTDALRKAVLGSKIPIVAIGGIQLSTLPDIVETGVHSWAIISAILGNHDIKSQVLAFNNCNH